MFYKYLIPAKTCIGSHTFLIKQIHTVFLLGDGWIVLHDTGARLGISLINKITDVAQWYILLFYVLGYVDSYLLGPALTRKRKNKKPYYQIRTFTFYSFIKYRHMWYSGKQKIIPKYISIYLTTLCLAVCIILDGSVIKDEGFKLSTHSFTREENKFLCDLLFAMYGIKATVLNEKTTLHIFVYGKDRCLY